MTIVFVNLLFKDQDKAEVIGSAIQDACVHINSVLRVFRGQINKVFMFDKVNFPLKVWEPTNNLRLVFMSVDMGEREGIDTSNLELSVFIHSYNYSLHGGYGTHYVPGIVLHTLHISLISPHDCSKR